ncbi:30S ribosomal protein S4e [archaeon]|jgi:small subunit ribosomal protein S4e|nr:30S ribosomal protein S4e [archaeon]MBT3450716.1 30S ribosomal protein S4e [archaeon]MBT6869208.1 30S ribosomal protein S4e [archaeon]MBT7193744.1 30S ribosomal protein S4e [archaeon]MBT7381391.1 30S ribosomal protein S4e [archaeon]
MKNHLKRIAAPRTWMLSRKSEKFTLRPNPGSHKLDEGMPLGTLLRDHLKLCKTLREAQKLLNNNEVFVDNKRKKDRREMVGLFDVIKIPSLSKNITIDLDLKGRLIVRDIDEKNLNVKVCRVLGKSIVKGNKLQLNLIGGKNLITDKINIKVGDSVLLNIGNNEIQEILPLKKDTKVLLVGGKHSGTRGKLKEIDRVIAKYVDEKGEEHLTRRSYVYVLN